MTAVDQASSPFLPETGFHKAIPSPTTSVNIDKSQVLSLRKGWRNPKLTEFKVTGKSNLVYLELSRWNYLPLDNAEALSRYQVQLQGEKKKTFWKLHFLFTCTIDWKFILLCKYEMIKGVIMASVSRKDKNTNLRKDPSSLLAKFMIQLGMLS